MDIDDFGRTEFLLMTGIFLMTLLTGIALISGGSSSGVENPMAVDLVMYHDRSPELGDLYSVSVKNGSSYRYVRNSTGGNEGFETVEAAVRGDDFRVEEGRIGQFFYPKSAVCVENPGTESIRFRDC